MEVEVEVEVEVGVEVVVADVHMFYIFPAVVAPELQLQRQIVVPRKFVVAAGIHGSSTEHHVSVPRSSATPSWAAYYKA